MRYVRIGDAGPNFRLKMEILANVMPEVTNIAVLNTGGNFHFLFFTKSKSNSFNLIFDFLFFKYLGAEPKLLRITDRKIIADVPTV